MESITTLSIRDRQWEIFIQPGKGTRVLPKGCRDAHAVTNEIKQLARSNEVVFIVIRSAVNAFQ